MSQARTSLLDQAHQLRFSQSNPESALRLLLSVTTDDLRHLRELAKCYSDLGQFGKAREINNKILPRVAKARSKRDEAQCIAILEMVDFEARQKEIDFDKINQLMELIAYKEFIAFDLKRIKILALAGENAEAFALLKTVEARIESEKQSDHYSTMHFQLLSSKQDLASIFRTEVLSDEEAITLLHHERNSPNGINALLVNLMHGHKFVTHARQAFLQQILESGKQLTARFPNNPIYLSTYASMLCKGNEEQIKQGFELHEAINRNHANYSEGFVSHAYDLIAHDLPHEAIRVLENIVDAKKRKPGSTPVDKKALRSALKTMVIAYDNKIQSTDYGTTAKSQLQKRQDEENRHQYYQRIQHAAEAKSATAKRIKAQARTHQKGLGAIKKARELSMQAMHADRPRFNKNHPQAQHTEIKSSIRVDFRGVDYSTQPLEDADGFRLVTTRHRKPVTAAPSHGTTEEKKAPTSRPQTLRSVTDAPTTPERVIYDLPTDGAVSQIGFGLGLHLQPSRFAAIKNKKDNRRTIVATTEPDDEPVKEEKDTPTPPVSQTPVSEVKTATAPKRKSRCDAWTKPVVSQLSFLANSASQVMDAGQSRLTQWRKDLGGHLTSLWNCPNRYWKDQKKREHVEALRRRIGKSA